jgi:hypothetical protein
MRKTLTGLLSLAVLLGTAASVASGTTGDPAVRHPSSAPPAPAAAAAGRVPDGEPETAKHPGTPAGTDIKERVLALPGMRLIKERQLTDHRFFVLGYTQPVDHRDRTRGTFEQRLTLLHRDTARPTVFHTSGYGLSTSPVRSEPTRLVDGNEVSLEHRFFAPSRPSGEDWSPMTIRQAADDQHRLFRALKRIYDEEWIATGASKGGMTAVFYERFHPDDMDAVVAYVSPNDVDDDEDSAYDRFFARVGTPECRSRLDAVQREALVRREEMERRLNDWAAANRAGFKTLGSLSLAYEAGVRDLVWNYWQSGSREGCAWLPDPAAASDEELFGAVNWLVRFSALTDKSLAESGPYYYQAGTELGSPALDLPQLAELTRFERPAPRVFVPRSIPMSFRPEVMRDVDRWVRHHGKRLLFVNGALDPWSAEPFRLGRGTRDSLVLTAPRADHGAQIADLAEADRVRAVSRLQEWTGTGPDDDPPATGGTGGSSGGPGRAGTGTGTGTGTGSTDGGDTDAAALAPYDPVLDRREDRPWGRHPGGAPAERPAAGTGPRTGPGPDDRASRRTGAVPRR